MRLDPMPYRKRVALFVLSILIPASVFAGLGIEIYRQQQSKLRFAFYAAAIVFALGLTLFCRLIVWREMQKERDLAKLRAQFVTDVSHELRTPLTSIRMFAETLAMGRVPDPASQQKYLETIARESRRLARLVDDVLAFSKLEAGAARYSMERIALAPTIEAALSTLEHPIQQKGFSVHLEIADEPVEVEADAGAMEQALLNLLTNAMKFSGDSREIGVSLLLRDKHAVIEVADLGIGIPVEHRRRVFERFFRIPLAEHQAVPGVGVGLTLVEGILKAHHGTVEVRDNTPKGVIFSLHLPVAASA
jgi:two-component system, OmpR family, phosphate regulon sensor histidine kinase PhoR